MSTATAADTGVVRISSNHSVADTAARLESALKERGILVFAHLDFTADGSHALASCEFSGTVAWLSLPRRAVLGTLRLGMAMSAPVMPPGPGYAMPQDVRLSADGDVFYVADMAANGVWLINSRQFTLAGFLHTGAGTHGLEVGRDRRHLYVSNRGEGSVSVVDLTSRAVAATWHIPGGGSPDMGGVSADGKVLWLAGRYNSDVYAIDTTNGHLLARIPVGHGPHGLCIYPQPGRYSLGHTGVFR